MSSISAIAGSGLDLASLMGTVSANNVANGLTNGFVPSRVDAVAQAGGGVTGTIQQPPSTADTAGASTLNSTLVGLSSGTDMVSEVVNQTQALAAFQANLKVLEAAQSEDQALVSIHG